MNRISLAQLSFCICKRSSMPETSANFFPRKICHKTNYVRQMPLTRLRSSSSFASRNSSVPYKRPFNFGEPSVCIHQIFRQDHKRIIKISKNSLRTVRLNRRFSEKFSPFSGPFYDFDEAERLDEFEVLKLQMAT